MTRSEFEDIESFLDLYDLCQEVNCYELDGLMDEEGALECIRDIVNERRNSLSDIVSVIEDIQGGGDFYIIDGGIRCIDDDFCDIKHNILMYMIDNDCFDEEEQEDETESDDTCGPITSYIVDEKFEENDAFTIEALIGIPLKAM